MAVINMLPAAIIEQGFDPTFLEFKFGDSGGSHTTSEAYTNVLVELGIGGSSSYQNVTYPTPDKTIVLKHHQNSYWGTWLYYESLPAGSTFTIGNSGGYSFMAIVKVGE